MEANSFGSVAPVSIWTTGRPVPSAEQAGGTFFDMISRGARGASEESFLSVDTTRLSTKHEVDELLALETSGVIVSGSPALLCEGAAWMERTMEALVQLDAREVPILGICFGHQLLGQALGGKVELNPNGREIGTCELVLTESDPLLSSLSAPPIVVMTHVDSVVVAPSSAQVIAHTRLEPHAALRFSKNTWGVQFHPEMTAEIVGCYLRERREGIAREGIDVDALLEGRRESAFGTQLLEKFAAFCKKGASFD